VQQVNIQQQEYLEIPVKQSKSSALHWHKEAAGKSRDPQM